MIEYSHEGMTVASFHDERTGSFQYVVVDGTTKGAAIIDPVTDFDPAPARPRPPTLIASSTMSPRRG